MCRDVFSARREPSPICSDAPPTHAGARVRRGGRHPGRLGSAASFSAYGADADDLLRLRRSRESHPYATIRYEGDPDGRMLGWVMHESDIFVLRSLNVALGPAVVGTIVAECDLVVHHEGGLAYHVWSADGVGCFNGGSHGLGWATHRVNVKLLRLGRCLIDAPKRKGELSRERCEGEFFRAYGLTLQTLAVPS